MSREDDYYHERRDDDHYRERRRSAYYHESRDTDHYTWRAWDQAFWEPQTGEPPGSLTRALRVAVLSCTLGLALALGLGILDAALPEGVDLTGGWRTVLSVFALVLYLWLMKEFIAGLYRARPNLGPALIRLATGVVVGLAAGAALAIAAQTGLLTDLLQALFGLLTDILRP